jgi:hypothetical protein
MLTLFTSLGAAATTQKADPSGRGGPLCAQFAYFLAASHLEIFTGVTIEVMLGISILGRAASVGGTRRQ